MTTKEMLVRIETKLDSLSRDIVKVVYALIGVVAATIGSNFINSPIHVIVSSYVATFGGVFVIASVAHKWSKLTPMKRAIRLLFSVFVLFSVICREWVLVRPPSWFDITINIFFAAISILLVITVWKDNSTI